MSTLNHRNSTNTLKREAALRLRITAAAERHIRTGHPWVYADSVREQNRAGTAGELGVVFDRADKFLAIGFFDPDSPIRLRVLHTGKPLSIDEAFWRARLESALARRATLFDEQTTGYRVINGESDGWPGFVLDRYGTTLVVKIYTAAWLSRMDETLHLLVEQMMPERVVLRMSRNLQSTANGRDCGASPHWRDGAVVFSKYAEIETGAPVEFRESGLRFEADVWRGQKTGFFLDQRENRRWVESFARGRTVLNAFSFSGGFSVYAARGGAKSVTDLDISKHALASGDRNFRLNWSTVRSQPCKHESIPADAFTWLGENADRKFDLIVLDPPSFAKREAERAAAIQAYVRLTASGIKHLNSGGIMVACSCSAHVSTEEFFTAVRTAARHSGRRFIELQTAGHAPDHPATFAEAEYLKGIYLRF